MPVIQTEIREVQVPVYKEVIKEVPVEVPVEVEKVVEKIVTVLVPGPETIKTVEVIKQVPVYKEREAVTVSKDVVVHVREPPQVLEVEVRRRRPNRRPAPRGCVAL